MCIWKEVHLLKRPTCKHIIYGATVYSNRTRCCHRPNTWGVVWCGDELFILSITSLYRLHVECVCARACACAFSFGSDLLCFSCCRAQKRVVWKLKALAHIKRNHPALQPQALPLLPPLRRNNRAIK